MFFFKKRGPLVLVAAAFVFGCFVASASALESYQQDLKRLLAEAKVRPEGRKLKAGKGAKKDKMMMMMTPGTPAPSRRPTPDPTPAPTPGGGPNPAPAPTELTFGPTFITSKQIENANLSNSTELYKEVLTCGPRSQPTFCQSTSASITCDRLTELMNECTALSPGLPPDGKLPSPEDDTRTYTVYDPNNCGDGLTLPIAGCLVSNPAGEGKCRRCGNNDPNILPCATGFYGPYYAANTNNDLSNDENFNNRRAGVQSIADMLGIPVAINCTAYYERLEFFRSEAEDSSFGPTPSGQGFCRLNNQTFDIEIDDRNFGNLAKQTFVTPDGQQLTNEGAAVVLCPPHIIADYTNNHQNANYQHKSTRNFKGEVFPPPGSDPSVAVSRIPAQIPFTEIDTKCSSLALGQEANIFDAGEILNFELTAKAMAERMLRPSTFTVKGLANCCDFDYPGGAPAWTGTNGNCPQCKAHSASSIENPTNWVNVSLEVDAINDALGLNFTSKGSKKIIGGYVLHVPSATRPLTTFGRGQRTRRVAKQMHGKGYACIYGKFSFGPLRELYAKNLQEGDQDFIPPVRRVGLLDERLVNGKIDTEENGSPEFVAFDTLVRFAGKVNITDIKDVHDERIGGLGLKIFGVGAAFNALGIEYNQLWLPFIPPFDQPEIARYVFGEFNFFPQQEFGTIDLTHVAIGTGAVLGTSIIQDNLLFDPDKEVGFGNVTSAPDNVFTATNNVDYYNGFILGGPPPLKVNTLTNVYQNPLNYVYGTASPHRAGPAGSMRISWARCRGEISKIQNVYSSLTDAFKDGNFKTTNLRHTIENLANGTDFKMCGYATFQEDPCTENMERPEQRWTTRNIKLFELSLPKQTVPDYNMFCDNTVLAPYRMIKEHTPQGFLQRVRNPVYVYAWQFRLILNNGAVRLPKSSITNSRINPSESQIDTGITGDYFLGDELCPFGYSGFLNGAPLTPNKASWEQFGKVEVGTRPKYYQGQAIATLTSVVGTPEQVDDENLKAPSSSFISSAGPCLNDAQCKLKFGDPSTCDNPGFVLNDIDFPSGQCTNINNGQFNLF